MDRVEAECSCVPGQIVGAVGKRVCRGAGLACARTHLTRLDGGVVRGRDCLPACQDQHHALTVSSSGWRAGAGERALLAARLAPLCMENSSQPSRSILQAGYPGLCDSPPSQSALAQYARENLMRVEVRLNTRLATRFITDEKIRNPTLPLMAAPLSACLLTINADGCRQSGQLAGPGRVRCLPLSGRLPADGGAESGGLAGRLPLPSHAGRRQPSSRQLIPAAALHSVK